MEINFKTLKRYPIDIPVELEHLIPDFLERRKIELKVFTGFLASQNFEEIEKMAHKAKGHGGGFGFDGITDIAREIENASMERDLPKLTKSIEVYGEYIVYLRTNF